MFGQFVGKCKIAKFLTTNLSKCKIATTKMANNPK